MNKVYTVGILGLGLIAFVVGVVILVAVPTDAFTLQTEYGDNMYVPFFLEGLQQGDRLPSFEATDLNGNRYNTSDLGEKRLVVKFWSPRCTYCRGEIPSVRRQYQELGDDVVFLTIVSGVPTSEVQGFVEEQEIPYPVIVDEDAELRDLMDIKAIPLTYFVDGDGKITDVIIGAIDAGGSCSSSETDLDECRPE